MTSIDEHATRLLERIGVLRHPSDLDLLIFFARHPRSLLASEHLSALLGYGIKEIAASLDLLVEGGLVTRKQSERHAARMFVFASGGPARGWFPGLVTVASTRDGRLAMLAELRRTSAVRDAAADVGRAVVEPGPRPFLVRRRPAASQGESQ